MNKCPNCNMSTRPDADFCTYCGATLALSDNFCTNPNCKLCNEKYQYARHEQYCKKCGALTTFGKTISELI